MSERVAAACVVGSPSSWNGWNWHACKRPIRVNQPWLSCLTAAALHWRFRTALVMPGTGHILRRKRMAPDAAIA